MSDLYCDCCWTSKLRVPCRFLLLSEKMTKCQGNYKTVRGECDFVHIRTATQAYSAYLQSISLLGGGSYRGIIPNRNGIKFKLKFIPLSFLRGEFDFLPFNLYRYRIIVSMLTHAD
jgi:hypothetical protein